jgi:hypothetical protein
VIPAERKDQDKVLAVKVPKALSPVITFVGFRGWKPSPDQQENK